MKIHATLIPEAEMLIAALGQPVERRDDAAARVTDEHLRVRVAELREVDARTLVAADVLLVLVVGLVRLRERWVALVQRQSAEEPASSMRVTGLIDQLASATCDRTSCWPSGRSHRIIPESLSALRLTRP